MNRHPERSFFARRISGLRKISSQTAWVILMFSAHCNIDKTDRINRSVIGAILLIAALIGMSWTFYMVAGAILIIEGIIGWCSIPYLVDKIKRIYTLRK